MVRQTIGLVLGPVLFAAMLLVPESESLGRSAIAVAAVTLLMATFWITEAMPIAATALLPIALFPALRVMPTAEVTSAYANHLIYLFLGGFLIAMAIQRWQLHRRIALHTIRWVGTTPNRIVLGFMLATAFLSSWISNTAAVMMMVTIGIAVLHQIEGRAAGAGDQPLPPSTFGTLLMLAIAYSASIGGVATLIGTPPNAILAGIVESRFGYSISFAGWMLFGLPLSLVMLAFAWFYLTRIAYRVERFGAQLGREALRRQLAELGPMSPQERRVLAVFVLVVAGWLSRGFVDWPALAMITDSSIAIGGALLLFVIPADWGKREFLLDWRQAAGLPWEVIVLFGGGFALAAGFGGSGLTEWIGGRLTSAGHLGLAAVLALLILMVIFMTEVTSNTATASLLLPVMIGFAAAADLPPLPLLVAVTVASSYAFMLPVATPPNAIVFGSKQVTVPQMARAGLWLNLAGAAIVWGFVLLVLPWVPALG